MNVQTETTNKDQPNHPSLAHARQVIAAEICRDCQDGPLAIRAKGTKYLPQFPREEHNEYKARLATSVFYDAFSRTTAGLTGMVFRKPPKLEEKLPPDIHEFWENVDLLGTHGDVFCQRAHKDGEVDGHFVIFVDMQEPVRGARTLDDERRAKRRPYWVSIRKQNVLDARMGVVGGMPVLVHFRYREIATVAEGKYGEKQVERIREYNLKHDGTKATHVEFILHTKQVSANGTETWDAEQPRRMSIDEIPAVAGYHGEKLGPFESRPPHLSLALENIKHYQLVSDNDSILHMCSAPQWVLIGAEKEDGEAVITPHGMHNVPTGGDLKCVGPTGAGLSEAKDRIQKSEYRMAMLGLSMLMSESRAAETATSKRIDKAESDSALSDHVRASQDAFEEALRLTAKWYGVEMPTRDTNTRWLSLNRDFEGIQLDAQKLAAFAKLVEIGRLTQETLWAIMMRAGELPESFDAVKEAAQLEEDNLRELEELAKRMKQADAKPEGDPAPQPAVA